MELQFRHGTSEDLDSLAQLYDDVHDNLSATTNYPGWQKGNYPTRQDAEDGLHGGCLFVATQQGELIGSMILRSQDDAAYDGAAWGADLAPTDVLVIHTFAVSPRWLKCGVGRQMLACAEQYARDSHIGALRLDVHEKNSPAIHLYESCGYRYIATVSLGLEEYGLKWFKLYEKLI